MYGTMPTSFRLRKDETEMKITKKILSMILAFVLVLGLLPATTLATETEDVVYLSISFDSNYIDDKNGDPIAYIPVPMSKIEEIDLVEYGLDNMLFDADGDGNYETTALQLLIYAHEELYGGSWDEVRFDALPGSSYFAGGIFGFTENLVYFLNGDFPIYEDTANDAMTTGATSDRIVLKAGDFLDVASFSCYSFLWDENGGFHLFADQEGNYVHDYATPAGEALPIQLKHSFCDLMYGKAWVKDAADYEVFYGAAYGEAEGSVFTDENGYAEIIFPNAGTYYVWCKGGSGDEMYHTGCDYYYETEQPCIVNSPAFAKVTVTGGETPDTPQPEQPRVPQSVTAILNDTMAQLANTVTEPAFGTNAGEWTVFCLARGKYFQEDSKYFADYYDRIVEYVNTQAAKINMNGALDKSKSTDNARLIMALAAIGKDAASVGNWDLVEAYSANGINWIKKQGLNGPIWALIALDCGNYQTSDPTIRQQCVDTILSQQHTDGGWSLMANTSYPSNVDITGMTLTALYSYRNQPAVAAACEQAIAWLSDAQLATGGFPYGEGETSESCAWAIVSLTTWGINPDTDPRFIKNGKSAVDNLLSYYVPEDKMFAHEGRESNAMATDQATYAMIAYDRFLNGKPALYDYSDVTYENNTTVMGQPTATLGLPAQITDDAGKTFNAVITLDQWDNTAGVKLIDFVMLVPEGLSVASVTPSSRLAGGQVSYHLEEGKLRVTYFDPNEHNDITVVPSEAGNAFPAQFFTVTFTVESAAAGSKLELGFEGMSAKFSSDPADLIVINTAAATGSVEVVRGIAYSAVCLYTGDDVDLIPSTKKAIAVSVTGMETVTKLTYNDGSKEYTFRYSAEISAKTGLATYVALVDASLELSGFENKQNFTLAEDTAASITFGDANGDGVINAQDALAAVDTWLRKGDAPTDDKILILNVNSDGRINTFDALGIVEKFVDGSDFGVVTKAATITTNP